MPVEWDDVIHIGVSDLQGNQLSQQNDFQESPWLLNKEMQTRAEKDVATKIIFVKIKQEEALLLAPMLTCDSRISTKIIKKKHIPKPVSNEGL